MSQSSLYILVDGNGFTTAVSASNPVNIFKEYQRLQLARPLKVHKWERNGARTREGWALKEEFIWGGEDIGVAD